MKSFKDYIFEAIGRKRIIMIGGPGSGKSTYSEIISKELEIPHIYTGDMMRKLAQTDTPDGKKVKELLAKGEFAPTPIVNDDKSIACAFPKDIILAKIIKSTFFIFISFLNY